MLVLFRSAITNKLSYKIIYLYASLEYQAMNFDLLIMDQALSLKSHNFFPKTFPKGFFVPQFDSGIGFYNHASVLQSTFVLGPRLFAAYTVNHIEPTRFTNHFGLTGSLHYMTKDTHIQGSLGILSKNGYSASSSTRRRIYGNTFLGYGV